MSDRNLSGYTLLFVGAHPDDETFGLGGTLAYYARQGVKVYYACATRGEAGTTDPEYLKGFDSMGDMRWAEMEKAAAVLGLSGVIWLGFRDSGMAGAADNRHPQALTMASPDLAEEAVVKIIRQVRPQVIVTHDPQGGYGHPDHIAVNQSVERAFYSAADVQKFTGAGLVYQPQKLYYTVFSRRILKMTVRMMELLGRDTHHFGRNGDIDLASLAERELPVTTSIRPGQAALRARDEATACYCSQLGGRRQGFMRWAERFFGKTDLFMRVHPPAGNGRPEHDLFAGIMAGK